MISGVYFVFIDSIFHELGHLIVALIFGFRVIEFQPFYLLGNAHVTYVYVYDSSSAWMGIILKFVSFGGLIFSTIMVMLLAKYFFTPIFLKVRDIN